MVADEGGAEPLGGGRAGSRVGKVAFLELPF